jgi:Slime mold cyclic AMP receptor.
MVAQKMILFLVLSAFFDSIAYLLGDIDTKEGATCQAQAFLMQYFDWATLLWVLMITTNLILIIKNKQSANYYWIYHLVVWVGSLFWAIFPYFENTYGHAGLWCWITRDHPGYRFGTWFGPLLVICIGMFIALLYVIYTVYQATKAEAGTTIEEQNLNKRIREDVKPLAFYPLFYIILNIPTLLYRIEDASHPSKPPNYGLMVMAVIFGPSVGAVNAVIFALINLEYIQKLTWAKIKNQVMSYFKGEETRITHNIALEEDVSADTSSGTEPYQIL